MNTQTILSMNISKTKKILKLAELGLNTTEIANLIGSGYSHIGWKITSDGSILGDNAFEVVSPILEGEDGLDQLMRVCATLKACRAKINKSCGLHVHIDANNFELKHFKNIFKNYIQLEDVIDSFMPESRRGNNNRFCKSLKRHGTNGTIQKIDASRNVTNICSGVFGNTRYYKVNPMSFVKHGTIEFRQHSGTIEYQKIRNWVIFLHNLVSYSKKNVLNETNFETITKFNQPEVVAYFEERKNELNNN